MGSNCQKLNISDKINPNKQKIIVKYFDALIGQKLVKIRILCFKIAYWIQ